MAGLVKPALDRLFKKKIQGLITSLSSRVRVVAVLEAEDYCPNCQWDEISAASSGTYKAGGPESFSGKTCPICRGLGKIVTRTDRVIKARVRIGGFTVEGDRFTAAGRIPEGHARVKVIERDRPTLSQAAYFLLDGVRYSRLGQVESRGLLTPATGEVLLKRDD